MKFRVGIAAAIGFLVPVFLGFVAVLLFSPSLDYSSVSVPKDSKL
jgi:hypothetical protein